MFVASTITFMSQKASIASNSNEVDEHAMRLIELRKQLDPQVKTNVKVAQKRQKKHYDSRHQKGCYEVNQMVMLKNMKKLSKKGDS